ncbi:hypothetical protein WJR50_30000 [Catalinimonas sp. 4WD22]|uniref:hypothetical protein n=1 Tax=Catalinimonas locisalis TaxID=3133978 RepID=UPI0031013B8B
MKTICKTNATSVFTALGLSFFILLISSGFYTIPQHAMENSLFDQLGISQTEAELKIQNSMLGGYLDQQGVTKAKHILQKDRAAVTLDLLNYAKAYLSAPAFTEAYASLRQQSQPEKQTLQTPEALQAEMISRLQQAVADTETSLKNADASLKAVFESVLADTKQALKDAEDPNNAQMMAYRQNYEEMLKINEQVYQQQLAGWEEHYPADHHEFIKKRLQLFLEESQDIDFSAELTEKDKKMVFVNPDYEAKGKRWKMGYRAGKEVVQTARTYVEDWLKEIS